MLPFTFSILLILQNKTKKYSIEWLKSSPVFLINFGTSNKEQLSYKRHSSRQIVKNSDDPYEAIRNKRIPLDH